MAGDSAGVSLSREEPMPEYGKTFFMNTPVDSPGIGRLELVEYPHPALLRRTRPLVRIDDAIHDAVEQMFDIMYAAGGIGLAANQVALPYRLFIVNLEARADGGEELVFINPALSRPRGNAVREEGCLSLPGLRMDVRRPEQIVVKAWTLAGEPFEADLDGLLARVVQHEFDHLDGILYPMRMKDLGLLGFVEELEAAARGTAAAEEQAAED
ncbi:peptide deformylase [bacterium]|nr:peptide deformylase [bacterium]